MLEQIDSDTEIKEKSISDGNDESGASEINNNEQQRLEKVGVPEMGCRKEMVRN
jgi:hypothetical protein